MVAQPPRLRDHALPARTARAAARLGRRAAELHVDLPRTALGELHDRAARRPRPRPARRTARPDPRARRRCPSLCGRDGANAPRPRRARTVRRSLSARPASWETLEVPETLQALIAARLDGLSDTDRRLLQVAAVLGKTFTRASLASLSGLPEPELEPLLAALVRKEVLSLHADARSPEHGQYGFLQDLVRRVAYDTLARQQRKQLHLAAADFLSSSGAEDELAEVIAAPPPRRVRRLARCGRRAGAAGSRSGCAPAGRRARGLARRSRRGQAVFRAGCPADDRGRHSRAPDRSGRRDGLQRVPAPRGRSAARGGAVGLRSAR